MLKSQKIKGTRRKFKSFTKICNRKENARQKKNAKKTENYTKEFCGGGSAIKWN